MPAMLLAATTIFFRVHTRVLLTMSVALCVVTVCLTNSVRHPPAPVAISQAAPTAVAAEQPALPPRAALPLTAVRFFFLLPHLVSK
ncbi:MAG TPA: hypothetical protein VG734_25040 [Lacunisphaera sp.]|nr:hypothetical protein [Lacunisphaera sp.]